MSYSATMRTDGRLTPFVPAYQFETYHLNSRLDAATARELGNKEVQDSASRFLGTRGFRQFCGYGAVSLDTVISSRASLQKVMARRRSGRLLGGAINLAELATVLEQALGCTSILHEEGADLAHALRAWPSAGGLYPLDTYVIAMRVDGLDAGTYHYNPIRQQLEVVPTSPADCVLRRAFFDQPMTNAASVALLFVANFRRTTAKYGERGYRLVLLDAGHAGQNVLLVAEQLGLSATGVGGFCDDAVNADLQLDGVEEAPVHAIILGRPA